MNHTTWHRIKSGTGILLPFGLLLLFITFITGCGLSHKEMMAKDQMERAKKAYAEAKANPNVEAYAPLQLQEAGKALQAAEAAEQAKETDAILQLGYIAEKKTWFAVTTADGKVAERNIDKLNVENAELIAKKRTLEAERAKRETGMAMSEAERARREAGMATSEAERAKREAEKAMGEAEQARMGAAADRMAAAADAERAAIAKQQAEQAKSAAEAEAAKAAEAKAEADQLMRELSELKAQQTERGIVLTIGDVLFATGKANLSPDANKSVARLAEFLKKYQKRNVLIEGHTDSVGKDDYNLTLSRNRADSVKSNLVGNGIEAGRITTVGYGKKFPLASNDTKAGKAQNRRVEVIILNEGVKAETQFRM
ncbi:OmpA family protein [Candidatus Deferrimicrobium sp.]|uniref:OmpA family protein n=1 Tax=Candidatus Deferrimicrobium sp. TaxID=3060586 RepID=UPI002719C7BF|nr:OmpA family protein [Candidatus Deferrimicrobium sp.]MDO8738041.1 OmpA family protein [Candidatus Deferrimicrobium sp.]